MADSGLMGIIVAIQHPKPEVLDRLDELADLHDLKIYRWQVGLEER